MQKSSINAHLIPKIHIIQKNPGKAEKFRKMQKNAINTEKFQKFQKIQIRFKKYAIW
jgi:hypothetical protein